MAGSEAITNLELLKSQIEWDMPLEYQIAIDKGIEALKDQRPKGKWMPSFGNYICSVCGTAFDAREIGKATHYCSYCGADMREGE